jgi:YYY domain-containing protein
MAGQGRTRLSIVLGIGIGAITTGLLRATNTWDWLTFMLLGILGLGFAWWVALKRLNRTTLLGLVGRVALFVVISFLAALPYTTWYASVYNKAGPYPGPHTQLWMYFTIHGVFLFLILSLLAWDTARWLRTIYVRSLRGMGTILLAVFIMVAAVLAGAVVLSMSDYPVTIIAVPYLVWIALLFFRQGQSREMRYILALAGLAMALTLGVEYIVLDGDIGRQNTLFKFYIQAWMLFSVVGGAAVAWLVQSSLRWSGGLRVVWYGVAGLLFIVAAFYPFMASRAKSLDRMGTDTPFTLDGMTYMQYSMLNEGDPLLINQNPDLGYFSLIFDYNMIRWLQENIKGTPTIMEGQSDREYRWESRVAIYTGLPAVIGWNFHQRQQRTFDPLPRLVQQRVANVNAFYSTPDIDTAWGILQRYDVGYVIVSNLEKAYYPATGLAKFIQMVDQGKLTVVYEGGAATVYQVNKDANFILAEDAAGGI